uniref:Cytochrome P450 n=1 Tax=Schizophyllum commune (strain H4-8 / FGSC 9210) TaxID=578458 RepID=D8Q5V5_SCHCM
MPPLASILQDHWVLLLSAAFAAFVCNRLFTPPAELAHLPRVPVLPLLWSYFTGEVEDKRIKRLLMPFAERGEAQIARDISADITTWPKEEPPDDLLLWRLVGKTNVILSNGSNWQRHSRVVKSALQRNLPIKDFVTLAHRLFRVMKDGGKLRWDDLAMRFTLDAVGSTTFGWDFNSIEDTSTPFVTEYSHVMDSIANPLYIVFPKLETLLPRKTIITKIDALIAKFTSILDEKKENKGNDMLTYMLEDPEMSDTEFRDNMVVFFIAGHDTTAGAMSSLVYYFAKHPELQARARAEVRAALGDAEPTIDNMRATPFVQACIREALRVNTPIVYMVPRASARPAELVSALGKRYVLPAHTSVILNICAMHYNPSYWPNPASFDPDRFMNKNDKEVASVDASLWMPFALGPRQCPARNFALYEMRTLLCMLVREWEWALPADSAHAGGLQNGFSPFALSLPKDMDVVFRRRDKGEGEA